MSDLSMYEFGDNIAWDEFCLSDGHTVLLPGLEQANERSLRYNNCQKQCHVVVGGQDIGRNASPSKNAVEEMETHKPHFVNNKRNRMLETEPVSQTPVRVFDSRNKDSCTEACLARDAIQRFSNCLEINSIDPSGSDFCTVKTTAFDENSYSLPLSQQESNNVTFFDETQDIKNSGDLFYYGCPDISDLKEVEQLFSNKDEFGCFALPEALEAFLDESKPEFKFTYSNSCEHQINETHSSPRNGTRSWSETKDQLGVCGSSLHDEVLEEASKGTSFKVLPCKGIKKEEQPMVHESLSYTHDIHLDYSSPSDLSLDYGIASTGKFDNNCIKPNFARDSYMSNPVLYTESISFRTTPIVPNEKVPIDLGPSSRQDCSSVSSTLDYTSLEAVCFRQLHLVMEQLDLRTKLCIRDSLYRLARSAAQRHNNTDGDVGSSNNDEDKSRVMLKEGTNTHSGLIEIETDTNRLDRKPVQKAFDRIRRCGAYSVPRSADVLGQAIPWQR